MQSKQEILQSLADSVTPATKQHVDELSLGKGLAVGGAIALALKQFKLPSPSKFSRRVSAIEFAKSFSQAKDNKEAASAVVGLLNICARYLLSVPDLRDLGYRVMQVVNSEKIEDFFDG